MLTLEDYKTVFIIIGLIGTILFASPTLALILHLPTGERFSELYILGPGHIAEGYPFNVKAGENYSVYVGVVNHMGSSSYYIVCVKFRNQSEFLPNSMAGTPSSLPTLYEYRVFLRDNGVWEAPLNFSLIGVLFPEDRCVVEKLKINGLLFDVDKEAFWDEENKGYYYQLFIELWIYDIESHTLRFHNRFTTLWLNVTKE